MTQWLRAEEVDKTEPVTFYCPGAVSWDDAYAVGRRAGLRAIEDKREARQQQAEDNIYGEDDDVSGIA